MTLTSSLSWSTSCLAELLLSWVNSYLVLSSVHNKNIGNSTRLVSRGTYQLHGKTGNSSWKIKWFAPSRNESFRKWGLGFEVTKFSSLFSLFSWFGYTLLRVVRPPRLDCKTVRILAYSSRREQSNKRSGTRLKTESETGERRFFFSLASQTLR